MAEPVRAYTAEQIRTAERPLLDAGVPLMARAAHGLAEVVAGFEGSIALLVGSGDNGGDAMFAGAELAGAGRAVAIVPTATRMHERGLAAALAAGAELVPGAGDAELAARAVAEADVVVDGIVGTGGSGGLRGRARDIVARVLELWAGSAVAVVVAVDIPSGVGTDDGAVPDPVVLPATVTVTFGGYKAGQFLQPAAALCGEIRLVDIGIGPQLAKLVPALEVPATA